MLEHEQVHFDINEVVARWIRRCIQRCEQDGGNVFGPDLRAVIQELFTQRTALNAAFDKQTHQDASALPVRWWQAWVRRELTVLAAYRAQPPTVAVTHQP